MNQSTLVNHFTNGAWYPVGGSSEVAMHCIPAIERAGGKVLVRCKVKQILCDESGRAIGELITIEDSSKCLITNYYGSTFPIACLLGVCGGGGCWRRVAGRVRG